MYVCVLGIPKGKFSKQMKKKISYRIIITIHSQTNKDFYVSLWVTWSRLCINKLRKNAFNHIIKFVSDLWQVWFSPGTPFSSTNKTDRHHITQATVKVALNTITLTPNMILVIKSCCIQEVLWIPTTTHTLTYLGEGKLVFNEMMIRFALYWTKTLSWIFLLW